MAAIKRALITVFFSLHFIRSFSLFFFQVKYLHNTREFMIHTPTHSWCRLSTHFPLLRVTFCYQRWRFFFFFCIALPVFSSGAEKKCGVMVRKIEHLIKSMYVMCLHVYALNWRCDNRTYTPRIPSSATVVSMLIAFWLNRKHFDAEIAENLLADDNKSTMSASCELRRRRQLLFVTVPRFQFRNISLTSIHSQRSLSVIDILVILSLSSYQNCFHVLDFASLPSFSNTGNFSYSLFGSLLLRHWKFSITTKSLFFPPKEGARKLTPEFC